MADVCEVTGTGVDLMGDAFPNGTFQLQRTGDSSFPGTDDVSIGQPIPLVTNASGVFGHFENGSFVAGFALVQNSTYYLTPFRSDTQAALPRIRLSVPDGTTAANIATLVITDPVPPLDQAAQAVLDARAAAADAEAAEANAAASATAAGNSATAAAASETNAGTSASDAATSETNAGNSASAAATSESNAATSETNAANSASAASTSETNAGNSATAAATSETNAGNSATAAAGSATAAAQSATDAAGFVGQDLFATSSTSASRTVASNTFAVPTSGAADITITSGGSTATLNTITGAANNKYILLRPASGQTITLTHSTTTTDGFVLNGADVVLSEITQTVLLRYTGSRWIALGGSALLSGGGGGSGIYERIGSQQNASGQASVDFTTSFFDSTRYINYFWEIYGLRPTGDGRTVRVSTSPDGTNFDQTLGDYRFDNPGYSGGTGNQSFIIITASMANDAAGATGRFWMMDPHSATDTIMRWQTSAELTDNNTRTYSGSGRRTEAEVVEGVRFDVFQGFNQGLIQMYGELI